MTLGDFSKQATAYAARPSYPVELVDRLVARAGATLSPAMLAPASAHTIATRMLRNLIGSFSRRGRRDRVRAAAALVLALEPDDRAALEALALASDEQDN